MGVQRNRTTLYICLVLAVLTLAVYGRSVSFGFVYDDVAYVENNRTLLQGVTVYGLGRALVTHYQSNWHPLTWISLMLDAEIGGGTPGVFHATNIVLHIANTILLFLFLQGVTGFRWRSALVAALFALHPLHVESVAWITERKDVLSTLFWIFTMMAYVHYVRKPGARRYALVIAAFLLGLMAKPMLVSLPIVLLLLDIWPLDRRISAWKLVKEKTPLFVMSAASCVVTFWAQSAGSSVQNLSNLPIGQRVANAVVSYVAYLVKTLYPARLSVFYPHPEDTLPLWQVAGALALLVLKTALAVWSWRKRPYLTVGWLWYMITLLPVIGLVQVGLQGMADRYTYVPLIGIFIAAAWLGAEVWEKRLPSSSRPAVVAKAVAVTFVSIVLCLYGFAAYNQVGHWRSDATLFGHALDVDPNNYLARVAIAGGLMAKGKNEEAIAELRTALRLKDHPLARYNLGIALDAVGRRQEAGAQFAYAFKYLVPKPGLDNRYGIFLAKMGRLDDAIWHFKRALRNRPGDIMSLGNLGCAYYEKGDFAASRKQYEAIIALDPGNQPAREALRRLAQMPSERKRSSGDRRDE